MTRQGAPGATVPSAQRGRGACAGPTRGRLGALLAAAVAAGTLGGCGNRRVALDAPVQWWHDLEGGTIAQQRPPPPGVGQPYPRIGTVPARPALPDAAARTGETDRLAAQREQVERALTRTPLPAPGTATAQALASEGVAPAVVAGAPAAVAAPGATPPVGAAAGGGSPAAATPGATAAAGAAAASTGQTPAAAADPNLASATLDAAAAPPAAPAAKARAVPPAAPSQRATPQELAALRDSAPAEGAPLVAAGQTADAGVMLPPVAAEPPPAPSFEVAAADGPPPGVAAEAPPARGPLSRATPLEPLSRRGTPVRFQPGSAVLLPDQAGVLRALAGRRGKAPVSVTGYGDAGADTPDAQSDALSLGLQRAQAMSAVLGTYGVPAAEIRIAAEAFGRGGTVRLLH